LQTWHVDVAGVCALVALAAVTYWGVIGPTFERRDRHDKEVGELRDEEGKARRLQAALRTSDASLAGVQRAIAARRLALEPASRLNERLSRLTDLAGHAGVQVDMIEPGKEQAGPMYTSVPIRLSGRGSYGQVVRLLVDLRRQMPDGAVDEVTLVAPPSATAPVATFSIGLTWHAAPPEAPVARK